MTPRDVRKVHLFEENIEDIAAIVKITGREGTYTTVADALNVYLWVLYQQASGKNIILIDDKSETKSEHKLENFVKDQEEARRFFEKKNFL